MLRPETKARARALQILYSMEVGHGSLDDAVTRLARLTGLQDAWTGTASTQFQGVVEQWRGTQHQVRESLDSIGRVLGAAGAEYAETEARATRMFG